MYTVELRERPPVPQASKKGFQKRESDQQKRVLTLPLRHRLLAKPPPPEPPLSAGCFLVSTHQLLATLHGDFAHTDILDGCPDNCYATRLRRKHINLIGALSRIAKETFDRVGRLNVSMHGLRELVNEVGSQRVASTIDQEERFSKVVTL